MEQIARWGCLLFVAIFIVPFIIIVVVLILKGKNAAWEGEVVDKIFNERRGDNDKMEKFYTLVVKTTDGKEKKVGIAQEIYNKFEKGDRIKKEKGKLLPEKV